MPFRTLQPLARLHVIPEQVEAWCGKWAVSELAVFGSLLREDFGPDSDVDLLVRFSPEARWSLLDHIAMEEELSLLLHRSVDLLSRPALERSENYLRRKAILGSAQVVYAA